MKEVKRIFIFGQCTLHWGRMEFGNIGNYYIIDPFFRELREVYPKAELSTTMQLSDEFCQRYGVETVPMEAYYDFSRQDNLGLAMREYELLKQDERLDGESLFIAELKKATFAIDFSGDLWGDNANFLGKDRFAVGCYRDLIAQAICPTVMVAGSPGPFSAIDCIELAKTTYAGFSLVTNREPVSTRLLQEQGFDLSHTKNEACPSFRFIGASQNVVRDKVDNKALWDSKKLKVGMILSGWNFAKGPFDCWPREKEEYNHFVELAKYIVQEFNADIFLLSHSNGFKITHTPTRCKEDIQLIHGRDFPLIEQLYLLLQEDGEVIEKIHLLDGIYLPEVTKGIISCFDILVSGRLHGAVAGISQSIPTVLIDYGHEPKAHKIAGFAEVAGVQDCVANPNSLQDMKEKFRHCIEAKS